MNTSLAAEIAIRHTTTLTREQLADYLDALALCEWGDAREAIYVVPRDDLPALVRFCKDQASRRLLTVAHPSTPRQLAGTITAGMRTAVYERDAYRCVACASYRRLSVDHVIPVSKGGTSTLDNLQTMCGSCNSSKGDR